MIPVRYGSCYASQVTTPPARRCPACDRPLPSVRARYCSVACKQRAYRQRRLLPPAALATVTTDRKRTAAGVAHTIYECPACSARFLGEQRCDDCNRFCRALGPGGVCPECDQPILLADLLE